MGTSDLLIAMRAAGLTASATGHRLHVTGPAEQLDRFRSAISKQRDDLIAALEKIGADDTVLSVGWRLYFTDRDLLHVYCTPPASHADILERHPDAVAAEPFTPTIRQPSTPMTASEETAIRAWLALIEETDPATIAEVIGQCQQDVDARDYFTGRAAAELNQRGADDDNH